MEKLLTLLQDTWKWTWNSKIMRWICGSTLLPLLSLPNIYKYYDSSAEIPWWVRIVAPICVFSFIYFCYLIRGLWRILHNYYVDSVYVFAIDKRRELSLKTNLFLCGDAADEESAEYLQSFCNTVKEVFDKLTKTNVAVSIKIVLPAKDTVKIDQQFRNAQVENISRDERSKSRNTDDYKKQLHTFMGNTAYLCIVNNISRNKESKFYYVNNNIAESEDYQNSSIDVYDDKQLPYNSELVCPIYLCKKDKEIDYGILGFICIDSPQTNTFKEKLGCEVKYLQSLAADLYTVFTKINSQS